MRGESIQEDLWQRDFTCNAMAMPITPDGEAEASTWQDPTEGLKDLGAGRIRMVHPARFREDPLRLIRAFRLACDLEFQVEDLTLETICGERDRISSVAAERIRDELFKIFACPHSLPWVLQMDEAGLFAAVFPELDGLKGLEQGRSHHLDAWNHTFEAYRILEEICREGFARLAPWDGELKEWIHREGNPCALLKMAVLFHDAGKSDTLTIDPDGEPHFYGHAGLGEKIVSAAMRRLRASHRDEERVRKWVRYHMGPAHMRKAMEKDHLTERAKIRLLRRLGRDAPGILVLSLADFLATAIPSTTSDKERSFHRLVDSLLELYFKRDAASVSSKHLATGKDLIDALGIPSGPMVGRLLRLLEEARVEGKITNRSEALLLARTLLEELSKGPGTRS
jgi:tRNA nucleotidyltransferase/poly(A) polymerase